jgi:hypothetical protein
MSGQTFTIVITKAREIKARLLETKTKQKKKKTKKTKSQSAKDWHHWPYYWHMPWHI